MSWLVWPFVLPCMQMSAWREKEEMKFVFCWSYLHFFKIIFDNFGNTQHFLDFWNDVINIGFFWGISLGISKSISKYCIKHDRNFFAFLYYWIKGRHEVWIIYFWEADFLACATTTASTATNKIDNNNKQQKVATNLLENNLNAFCTGRGFEGLHEISGKAERKKLIDKVENQKWMELTISFKIYHTLICFNLLQFAVKFDLLEKTNILMIS